MSKGADDTARAADSIVITDANAIARDVTLGPAAAETQRLLAAMVEGSEDAIIAFTPAGIILTWNRGAEAIFGAGAVTEFEYVASAAQVREGIEFVLTEALDCRVADDSAERGLSEVANPVGVVHKLIAGENITVMLERQDSATGRTEYAKGVGQAQERPERFLEELHRKRAEVAGDPIVERTAKEFAEDLWICGAGADPIGRERIALDEGKELQ